MPLIERELPGDYSEEQVREQFAEWQRDGNEFRTASGIEFRPENFATTEQAIDWLKTRTESWGAALVVRINQPRQDSGIVEVESKTGKFTYRVTLGWNPNPVVYVQIPNQNRERRLRSGGQRATEIVKEYRRQTADTGKNIWLVAVWSPA